jgi:glycosyltransferase involved in cell wall biosynthesis
MKNIPGVNINIGYEKIICLNPALIYEIISSKADVIICAGFSMATILVYLLKIITGIRYVIWMEGTHVTENQRHCRNGLRKILMRKAGAYIDAGSLSRKYMKSLNNNKEDAHYFTAYNCIEKEKFDRPQIDITDRNEKVILVCGQLIKRKGVIQAAEAYKVVVMNNSIQAKLHFVGQGPLCEYLKNYAVENKLHNISVLGRVEYGKIVQCYWNSDLFLLLSLEDPNPLVLFEALAAGLPSIVSEKAGNSIDFIKNGVNGYIVDPYDINNIAEKITEVINWDEKRRKAAAECSSKLLEHASYSYSANAFVGACKYAIKNKTLR